MQTWRLCIPTKWRLCIRIIYANLEALHSNKNGGGYATKMQTLEMIIFPRRKKKAFLRTIYANVEVLHQMFCIPTKMGICISAPV